MIVSIDIGTSYSSICMLGPDGKALPVDISTGASMFGSKFSLPSAVFVEDSGGILVGQAAMNSRKHKPQNFRMEFKRNLGEDIPILLGGRSFKPEELYTELFRHMKERAEKLTGEPIDKAYLTYPASYGKQRREKLCAAANAAGLFRLELVDEPTAAAMCYCAEGYVKDRQTLLVYDFGGGTFDVSLIRYENGEFQLLSEPTGLEQCGGMDIDYLISTDMRQAIEKELPGAWDELGKNENRFRRFTSQINELAVKAKHHLSAAGVFEEYIEIGMDEVLYRLDTERFNGMIAPLVGQTVQTCRRALDEAGTAASEVSAVLLVGGTSRIPLVQEMAQKITGKPALCAADLELIVAQGALMYDVYQQTEAREKAQREAQEKVRREAEAREKVQREAQEKARREAEAREKAQREAQEKARREAKAREKAQWEAQEKARQEAEAREKAQREAQEKARREAEARKKEQAAKGPEKWRLCTPSNPPERPAKPTMLKCPDPSDRTAVWDFYRKNMDALLFDNDLVSVRHHADLRKKWVVWLRSDGTVGTHGNNDEGQCNVGGWRNIVSIACGGSHTVGLQTDGTVVATGNNDYGQCNVKGWRNIVAIASDLYTTIGLRSDGTVVATGENEDGQCNVGSWHDIVSLACVWTHTVGLRADGTVVAVGKNENGQCDVGSWRDIVSVACSPYFTVGLRSDGTVVAAGNNEDGQCNVGGWHDIVSITCTWAHTVGLRSDGTVVAVGDNEDGQCNVGGWRDIVSVACDCNHTVGLRSDGTMVAVGDNRKGQCNVSGLRATIAVQVDGPRTIAVRKDGSIISTNYTFEEKRALFGLRTETVYHPAPPKTLGKLF